MTPEESYEDASEGDLSSAPPSKPAPASPPQGHLAVLKSLIKPHLSKVNLAALKQLLKDAGRSAASDWISGCKAAVTSGYLVVTALREKRSVIITLDQALALLFFVGLLFQVGKKACITC